jgi:beta-ribofuranosylaminobenzene 5'-phosphate synthase
MGVMQMKKLSMEIVAYPRIHISLIAMNSSGYRKHGGIGFAISDPHIRVRARVSKQFKLDDRRSVQLEKHEYSRLLGTLEDVYAKEKLTQKLFIEVSGELIPHHGFGSETSLRLACLELLLLLNGKNYDKEKLISLSGRGGVSGIGIHSYFEGGFIFDAGIKSDSKEFKPSNLRETRKNIPLKLIKTFVEPWDIGLYLNSKIKNVPEAVEADFFKNACPIAEIETYEILYHCVYGSLSSIIEKDKKNFLESVNMIQNTKWKLLERNLYKGVIEDDEKILFNAGASAVGMSSLGPLLYFLADIPIERVIENSKIQGLKGTFHKAFLQNNGRKIING